VCSSDRIACGADLVKTYDLAVEVETLAEQYGRARLLGSVPLLSDDEMQRVLDRFKGYGQQR